MAVKKLAAKELKSIKMVLYFYNPSSKGKRVGIIVNTNGKGKMVDEDEKSKLMFNYLHEIPTKLARMLKERGLDPVQL